MTVEYRHLSCNPVFLYFILETYDNMAKATFNCIVKSRLSSRLSELQNVYRCPTILAQIVILHQGAPQQTSLWEVLSVLPMAAVSCPAVPICKVRTRGRAAQREHPVPMIANGDRLSRLSDLLERIQTRSASGISIQGFDSGSQASSLMVRGTWSGSFSN